MRAYPRDGILLAEQRDGQPDRETRAQSSGRGAREFGFGPPTAPPLSAAVAAGVVESGVGGGRRRWRSPEAEGTGTGE